ncbi:MAG: flagellar biosynthesis regulator FlaF, partial [Parvibaculaceae bacterium]
IEEAATGSRARERDAKDRAITLLEEAEREGLRSVKGVEALLYTRRLWAIMLEDLARTDNDLPRELRANLISIGFWILKEAERVRNGEIQSVRTMIEITSIIRDGLK